MRPTCTTRLAATALAASLLAACSSGNAAEDPTPSETTTSPTATDTPTPDETTTSESPSSTETEGMTVEEAQQIVDATTAIYNEAVIRMLTEQRIDTRWYQQMESIYEDPMLEIVESAWMNAAKDGWEGYNTTDPEGLVDEVLTVTETSESCFAVNIRRDFTGVTGADAQDPEGVSDRYFIAFDRVGDGATRDGAGTGWIRRWDVVSREDDPADLCERENPGAGRSGEDDQ